MSLLTKVKSKIIVNPVNLKLTKTRIKEIFEGVGLPLNTTIPGVFNGSWGGKGDIIEAIDPTTNQVISKIQTVHNRYFVFYAYKNLIDL